MLFGQAKSQSFFLGKVLQCFVTGKDELASQWERKFLNLKIDSSTILKYKSEHIPGVEFHVPYNKNIQNYFGNAKKQDRNELLINV